MKHVLPKYLKMMESDLEVKQVEMHNINLVADKLIELKPAHELFFFATAKRLLDAYLQSSIKNSFFILS